MSIYKETAIEQALAAGNAPQPSLPFVLAGPIVRRAEPNGVWFWFACSQEITGCTPAITVYDGNGAINTRWPTTTGGCDSGKPELRVARLGERLWVALVKAQPLRGLSRGKFYGYELSIEGPNFSTSLTAQRLGLLRIPSRSSSRPSCWPTTPASACCTARAGDPGRREPTRTRRSTSGWERRSRSRRAAFVAPISDLSHGRPR